MPLTRDGQLRRGSDVFPLPGDLPWSAAAIVDAIDAATALGYPRQP
jgi:hypothetical protein